MTLDNKAPPMAENAAIGAMFRGRSQIIMGKHGSRAVVNLDQTHRVALFFRPRHVCGCLGSTQIQHLWTIEKSPHGSELKGGFTVLLAICRDDGISY